MSKTINKVILANFILNETYARKILPFFHEDYFAEPVDKLVFNEIESFIESYNSMPTKEALTIAIHGNSEISKELSNQALALIEDVEIDYQKPNVEWLTKESEKFVKDAAIINALSAACGILDGNDETLSKDSIPKLLADALAVSFETNIGHDYFDDAGKRYDSYTLDEDRLPFDIDILNKITRGGLPRKSLTIFLGGTGTGKTNILCHLSKSYVKLNKNVLYITFEMSEDRIGERVDANMINISINELSKLGKDEFLSKISKIRAKTTGTFILKEYPMHSASAANVKALIDELRIKKNFIPDVVLIDYLGIMASTRYRNAGGVNTNTYYKSVAEELRGLGQYYNIPVITAVQTNRGGSTTSELSLTDMADSFAVACTGDLVLGLVTNEELAEANQLLIITLKNRHNDLSYYKKFLVGVDRGKMRLYNLEDNVNTNTKDIPTPYVDTDVFEKKQNKRDFTGFK
jgi:replicative DNA helicase